MNQTINHVIILTLVQLIALTTSISQSHKFSFTIRSQQQICMTELIPQNIHMILTLRLGHSESYLIIRSITEKQLKKKQYDKFVIRKDDKEKYDYKFVYTPKFTEIIQICLLNTHASDSTYISYRIDTGHYAGDKQTVLHTSHKSDIESSVVNIEQIATEIIKLIQQKQFIPKVQSHYDYIFYSLFTMAFVIIVAILQSYSLKHFFIHKKII